MSIEVIIIQILILIVLIEIIATAGLWYSLRRNAGFYDRDRTRFERAEEQYARDRKYFDKRLIEWEDERDGLLNEIKELKAVFNEYPEPL